VTSMPPEAADTTPQGLDLVVQPEAYLIAWTAFNRDLVEKLTGFRGEGHGGQDLAEFAGRACYQSYHKPNAATATNEDYLRHILEVGHGSVLEHGSATILYRRVSRSFTHELVRHRHFSYSQLSQRYVPENKTKFVEPAIIAKYPHLHEQFENATFEARESYIKLLEGLEEVIKNETSLTGTAARKAARQAARAVLPNATESEIVVSGNLRAWRHFLETRGSVHADVEIRDMACLSFVLLTQSGIGVENAFEDMSLMLADDMQPMINSVHKKV
jgi:thymidylate synthase (FAD)